MFKCVTDDDAGTTFAYFCRLMDSFQIPWAPVFGMMAFHIPTIEFTRAEQAAGYSKTGEECYVIGVDVTAEHGDFGCKQERVLPLHAAQTPYDFLAAAKEADVQVVCAGHYHCVNTCIVYQDIRWVYGLKTGQYDYHMPGQLGGTLYSLENGRIAITHLPALVKYGAYLGRAPMFQNFFIS